MDYSAQSAFRVLYRGGLQALDDKALSELRERCWQELSLRSAPRWWPVPGDEVRFPGLKRRQTRTVTELTVPFDKGHGQPVDITRLVRVGFAAGDRAGCVLLATWRRTCLNKGPAEVLALGKGRVWRRTKWVPAELKHVASWL